MQVGLSFLDSLSSSPLWSTFSPPILSSPYRSPNRTLLCRSEVSLGCTC
ncbi:hypothetical protein HanXRQr2_Chr14g0628271 [Helianthus annuus]|uniref:Uncharacterized protein n=1 Tax=Helianthus annuus TaxID=4232 RepID=A0A9K3H507_HELAN|nr:hypothetical protein HanXRQr2_Chr14g0628271 [Helianthus annuus]